MRCICRAASDTKNEEATAARAHSCQQFHGFFAKRRIHFRHDFGGLVQRAPLLTLEYRVMKQREDLTPEETNPQAVFYTGDRLPKWKGDVFVGGMLAASGYVYHDPSPLRIGSIIGAVLGSFLFTYLYHLVARKGV